MGYQEDLAAELSSRKAQRDGAMDEQTRDKDGKFGSGGGSGTGGEKKTVSVEHVRQKISAMPSDALTKAHNSSDIDPGVKKEIAAELDRRADKNRAPPSEKEARLLGLNKKVDPSASEKSAMLQRALSRSNAQWKS